MFAKGFAFGSYLWLSLFLFPLVSLFGFNITILKLWLFLIYNLLGVVLPGTDVVTSVSNLYKIWIIFTHAWHIEESMCCLCSFTSFLAVFDNCYQFSMNCGYNTNRTDFSWSVRSHLSLLHGDFFVALHMNVFLSSCVQGDEQLWCHLFISTFTVSLFRFLVNSTFSIFFFWGLNVEAAVASLSSFVSCGTSTVCGTAFFGTILLS